VAAVRDRARQQARVGEAVLQAGLQGCERVVHGRAQRAPRAQRVEPLYLINR
jgi:hypothetical protein